MTVNAPNPGVYQDALTQAVVDLRNAFQALADKNSEIGAQGGATWLQTVIGMTAADAATVVSTLANLAALNAIYRGGTAGAALDYRSNSELLWGGK